MTSWDGTALINHFNSESHLCNLWPKPASIVNDSLIDPVALSMEYDLNILPVNGGVYETKTLHDSIFGDHTGSIFL